ncbi:MAG: lysine--tRNA ligase [Leptospirales bacterium]
MSDDSPEEIENSELDKKSEAFVQREEKYHALVERGIDVYPNRYKPDSSVKEIIKTFFNEEEIKEGEVSIAGRVFGKRAMGKAGFLSLKDHSGKIQVYSNNKLLSENDHFVFEKIDIGDIIGIKGQPFRTKTGEESIRAKEVTMLAKNLFPIPVVKEKDGKRFDEFSDVEARYRRRYLDLLVNPEVKETFILRSRIISEIRKYFIDKDFMEVETPMMQSVASGAAARPFETFHNTLGMPLFLRIAPELYLKRLVAGGFDRVFELNRNFRNEGISIKHNPEFTMLEVYQAYADYSDMMEHTESLFSHLAETIIGSNKLQYGQHTIDLTTPWERKPYLDIIKEKSGLDFNPFLLESEPSVEKAKEMAGSIGLKVDKLHTFWEVVDEVFSEKAEPELIQPILITNFPKAMSPLAKNIPGNDHLVERFEPYICGREMGNAFTELNDPYDQLARFEEQGKMKDAGQEETIAFDEDFIDVLKVGLPPTGGLGIGIDRLVMLFTNAPSIRDVILFPLLRKK